MKYEVTQPTITIDPVCEAKIKEWVRLCSKEISGLGKVVRGEDGSLHVASVYLLEQEVSAAETELDDNAVASLLYESRDDEGAMIFWWHSHVDMDVFWSGTDMDTIYQFGKNGVLLSAVYNKRGERKVSLYIEGTGYHPSTFLDDLTMEHSQILDAQQIEFCKSEFEEKVTERTYARGHAMGGKALQDGFYTGGSYFDDIDDDIYAVKKKVKAVSTINYADKTLENFGVPKNLIKTQKEYYQEVLTQWFHISREEREEWKINYFKWHDMGTTKASDVPVADYAEFADSFDWDSADVDRYCAIGVK